MNDLKDIYAVRYRTIQQESIISPFVFRRNAREAFKNYSEALRSESNALTTDTTSANTFYTQWQEQLIPSLEIIKSAASNKRLLAEIKKSFLLPEDAALQLVEKMSQARLEERKNEFIAELYSPQFKKARKTAAAFLRRTDEVNAGIIDTFISYELHRATAIDADMTIYDQSALLITRVPQGIIEHLQIRKYTRQTNKRIKAIDALTTELETQDDSLIASLFALHIDLVTIRASYIKYEKAFEKLNEVDRKSPAKRLALYEKHTASIRTAHLDGVAGITTLQDIQVAAKEIDTALMRVFDLNTRQYNELMLRMKKYRDLTRERTRLQKSLKTT